MALTWTLKLKDGMSGPAENAANALGVLQRKLKGVKGATDEATKEFTKTAPKFGRFSTFVGNALGRTSRAAQGLIKEGGKLDTWVQKIATRAPRLAFAMYQGREALNSFLQKWPRAVKWAQRAEQAWGKYGSSARAAGSIALKGAAIAIGATVAIGAGIASVIQQAADFQTNKAKSLFAFDKLLGGPEAATRAWDVVRAASLKTRTSLSETAASFQSLLSAGFTLPQTDNLFKQLADLKTLNPQANVEGIVRALAQVRSKSKLTAEEVHGQLGDAGLNIGLVYEELGKKLGKSRDEVAKLMAAGKIDANTGIAAIQAAISKQAGGGPAGELAGKAPKSFGESIAFAKDAFFDLLKLDFKPIMDMIGRLSQSEGAKKFGTAIEKIVGTLTDPKSIAFIESFIDKVGGNFFEGLGEGFEAVGKFFQDFDEGDMETMASAAKLLGQAIGGIGAAILFVSQAAAALWDWIGSIGDLFTSASTDVNTASASLGGSIIDGIVAGIQAKASAVADAVKAACRSAIDSAASVLRIGSPSKVFRDEVGKQIPAGMALGVQKGESKASDATARMGERAAEAGRRLSQIINNSSTSNRTQNNTINVNGSADQGTVNRLGAELRSLTLMHA